MLGPTSPQVPPMTGGAFWGPFFGPELGSQKVKVNSRPSAFETPTSGRNMTPLLGVIFGSTSLAQIWRAAFKTFPKSTPQLCRGAQMCKTDTRTKLPINVFR